MNGGIGREPLVITSGEALLIFDKWKSDRSIVSLSGKLIGWEVEATCRVEEANSSVVRLISVEGSATFSFIPSLPDMAFEYDEPTPSESGERTSGLIVAFPLRVPLDALSHKTPPLSPPPRERLIFIELADKST